MTQLQASWNIQDSGSESLFFEDKLEAQLFTRISRRIAKEENRSIGEARKILDGALGFLLLCAKESKGNFSPSREVDIGWHAFLMYTKEYAAFCQNVAGTFIHHCPTDEIEVAAQGGCQCGSDGGSCGTHPIQAMEEIVPCNGELIPSPDRPNRERNPIRATIEGFIAGSIPFHASQWPIMEDGSCSKPGCQGSGQGKCSTKPTCNCVND